MADIQRLSQALKAAHAAGDTAAAHKLAQAIRNAQQASVNPMSLAPQPQPQQPPVPASQKGDISMGTAFDIATGQAESAATGGLAAFQRLLSEGAFGKAQKYLTENYGNPAREFVGLPPVNVDAVNKAEAERLQKLSDTAAEYSDQKAEETGFYNMTTGDINSLSDFVDFVGQKGAQAGAYMAPSLASGAAPISMGLNYAFGTGEISSNLKEIEGKTQEEKDQIAASGGAIVAALEQLGIAKLLPAGASNSIIGAVASGVVTEGTTEGLQELVNIGAERVAGKQFTEGEILERLKEAAAAGGVVGGTFKAGTTAGAKVQSIFRPDGTIVDPSNLEGSYKSAAGDVARELQRIAKENNYNLKKVSTSASDGAKQALEDIRANNVSSINLLKGTLKQQLDPKAAESLEQLLSTYSPAAAGIAAGKKKVSQKVTKDQVDAIRRLVGPYKEGAQLLRELQRSNVITDLFKDGMKGGVSQFTDYFSPFGQSGAIYDPGRLANVVLGGGLAYQSGGLSLGIAGGGIALDALTGKRSKVATFVKKNKDNKAAVPAFGPSIIAADKLKAEQQKDRRAAVAKVATALNAPKPGPLENIILGTGLDRNGVESVIKDMQQAYASDPDFTAVLDSISRNLGGEGNQVELLTEIIPVIGTYAMANRPDLLVQPPDNIGLLQDFRRMPAEVFTGIVQPQAAEAPAQPAQPAQQEQSPAYQAGIQRNIDRVDNQKLLLNASPTIPAVEKAQLNASLDRLRQPLTNPVVAVQQEIQRLNELGVDPDLVDVILSPIQEAVTSQQRQAQGLQTPTENTQRPALETNAPAPPQASSEAPAALQLTPEMQAPRLSQEERAELYGITFTNPGARVPEFLKNKRQQPETPPRLPQQPTIEDDTKFDMEPPALPALSSNRISTRYPIQARSTENPITGNLVIDTASMKETPDAFKHNTDLLQGYVNFKTPKQKIYTPDEAADAFIDMAVGNLLYLHDSVAPEIRERSQLWYDGANKIATKWSSKYNVPLIGIGGALAALSPQKDWYQNVSLGERVLDIYTGKQDYRFDGPMMQTAQAIYGKPQYAQDLAEIQNKTLSEIASDDVLAAMWVRIYDQTYNDRRYRTVSSEGDFIGDPAGNTAWGSNNEISKAISVIRDPSYENVSAQMGTRHKVRNFFNNIVEPNGKEGDVTIDTHAVAGALLRPLSGNSVEVGHNFGTGLPKAKQPIGYMAAKQSGISGALGTYGIYADAYRQAAAQRGILPRQMQSITWEAIRGLYSPRFKQQKKNVDAIDAIWQDYKDGKLSLSKARDKVVKFAGGIDDPTWYDGSSSTPDAEKRDSSYTGELRGLRMASDAGPVDSGARRDDPGVLTRDDREPGLLPALREGRDKLGAKFSRRPQRQEVVDQFPPVKALFEIGKKGSPYENGITNLDQALELARALNITVHLFHTQQQMMDAQGRKNTGTVRGSFRKAPNGASGTVFALKEHTRVNDGRVSELDELTTVLHEIFHGVTMGPMSGLGPMLNGNGNGTNSVENAIGSMIEKPQGKRTREEREIIYEVKRLQDQLDVYIEGNPSERRSVRVLNKALQDLEDNRMRMTPEQQMQQEQAIDNYKNYIRSKAEFSVDPFWVYAVNPKLAKQVMPVTTKWIQKNLRQAGNKDIQFYSHPFAVSVAVMLAILAAEGGEQEEQEQQQPGALSPMPGMLTAA